MDCKSIYHSLLKKKQSNISSRIPFISLSLWGQHKHGTHSAPMGSAKSCGVWCLCLGTFPSTQSSWPIWLWGTHCTRPDSSCSRYSTAPAWPQCHGHKDPYSHLHRLTYTHNENRQHNAPRSLHEAWFKNYCVCVRVCVCAWALTRQHITMVTNWLAKTY